jgi:hypothetical protein
MNLGAEAGNRPQNVFNFFFIDICQMLFKYYMPKIRVNIPKISISPTKLFHRWDFYFSFLFVIDRWDIYCLFEQWVSNKTDCTKMVC